MGSGGGENKEIWTSASFTPIKTEEKIAKSGAICGKKKVLVGRGEETEEGKRRKRVATRLASRTSAGKTERGSDKPEFGRGRPQ